MDALEAMADERRPGDLLTARLRLRRLAPEDAAAVFAWRSDPRVARYQSWRPGSAAEVRRFLESLADVGPDTPGRWLQLGVALRATGELVGDCGIHTPAGDPRQAEVGITLAPAFQRRGLATEALTAVLGRLFGELGRHRVFASVDPRNTASLALLRRLGLRQEAHHLESVWCEGSWADDLVFALLRREWRPGGGAGG